MKSSPLFLERYTSSDYTTEQVENYKIKNNLMEGDVISNFTITDEPVIKIKFPVEGGNEKRKYRSCHYVNVDCSCGNNLWIKVTYFLKGEYKSCSKCRAKVREGNFRDLQGMRIWHTRCYEIKKSAKKQSIPFNLTPLYLKELFESQNNICGITGDIISDEKGNVSLDKRNPKLGYVIGNVQWTNRKSNMMKQDLSMEELVEWCKKVIKNNIKQIKNDLHQL